MSADVLIRLPLSRRLLLGGGLATAGAGLAASCAQASSVSGVSPEDEGVCLITPQATEGPYWFDPNLDRSDIRDGRAGIPLAIRVRVVEGADCAPIPDAEVHIWHCDAQGIYSGYDGQGPTGSTEGETFLRGSQPTGADGTAAFTTLYPGWYQGRTTHIHAKVFLDRNGTEANVLTCQLFFPDALSEYVYEHHPAYARSGVRDTLNRTDGIAQGQGWSTFGGINETADGYLMRVTLGVDRTATSRQGGMGPGRPGGPPSGGRPPGPPPQGGGPGAPPERTRLTQEQRTALMFPSDDE